jgi:hypothetical protein
MSKAPPPGFGSVQPVTLSGFGGGMQMPGLWGQHGEGRGQALQQPSEARFTVGLSSQLQGLMQGSLMATGFGGVGAGALHSAHRQGTAPPGMGDYRPQLGTGV